MEGREGVVVHSLRRNQAAVMGLPIECHRRIRDHAHAESEVGQACDHWYAGNMTPTLIAILLCVAGAILEGVCAGGGARRQLAALVQPRGAPPFAAWIAIGLYYYGLCFVLARGIFLTGLESSLHLAALALLLVIIVANAAWNTLFFRLRRFRASWLFFLPYSLLVTTLTVLSLGAELPGRFVLLGYALYLPYALWWTQRVAQLNPR